MKVGDCFCVCITGARLYRRVLTPLPGGTSVTTLPDRMLSKGEVISFAGRMPGLGSDSAPYLEFETVDGIRGEISHQTWGAMRPGVLEPAPTALSEFPTYPLAALPALPPSWTDTSWRNEACPSYTVGDLQVWLDFPDPEQREFPELRRFMITRHGRSDNEPPLLQTDDWTEVLAYVAGQGTQPPSTRNSAGEA